MNLVQIGNPKKALPQKGVYKSNFSHKTMDPMDDDIVEGAEEKEIDPDALEEMDEDLLDTDGDADTI